MSSKKQPKFTTKRFLLRPFELADARDVQRFAGEWIIADTTLNIPHPYGEGLAEEWIKSQARRFEDGTLATFAVTETDPEQLVGAVGLSINPEHAVGELGYWIGLPFWGRGYATEAVQALVNYGFTELRLNRVQARHLVRNPASGRVMRKIGMSYEGTLRKSILKWDVYEDLAMYSILVQEWRAEKAGA
ncbi:GNAT family N-acetyltransferase [Halomonas sp. ANAO-440]|uniref:GNAT family N-acetyltransferase n=1 Tax=Halomonas sp. ANAO-440 TaxID=2861360 RepID=UPI001CAA6B1F|nr:GNAT family N-acetyltransferase [Halomonas sp. ANAO-440]MBZ0331294.1 GNAT family N-acetyltransferase [Halomonas sp. ANAO-440]